MLESSCLTGGQAAGRLEQTARNGSLFRVSALAWFALSRGRRWSGLLSCVVALCCVLLAVVVVVGTWAGSVSLGCYSKAQKK